jgi:hypothetical protein
MSKLATISLVGMKVMEVTELAATAVRIVPSTTIADDDEEEAKVGMMTNDDDTTARRKLPVKTKPVAAWTIVPIFDYDLVLRECLFGPPATFIVTSLP